MATAAGKRITPDKIVEKAQEKNVIIVYNK
jgi:type III secretion system FlhB-like substrate exporter